MQSILTPGIESRRAGSSVASAVTRIRRRLTMTGVLAFLSMGRAAEPVSPPPPPTFQGLPITTDIHHSTKHCQLCHETGPKGPNRSRIKFGVDFRAGCACHYETPGDLRHPTDVAPADAMRARMPGTFPLTEGKASCVTCHSFEVLCAPEKPPVSSLRGAPYADRTAFCFRCHDDKQYERLNPHHQLDEAGRIVTEKCLYCHVKKPDETRATLSSVKLIGGMEMLCRGCHNLGEAHPAGKPHYVKPDLEYLLRMRQIEKQYGIILPLGEDGRITCITCHNPHDAGVIPKPLPAAKGAGENLRHRLPNVLCAECHWHGVGTPDR